MHKIIGIIFVVFSSSVFADYKFYYPKVKNVTMEDIASQYRTDIVEIALANDVISIKEKLNRNRKTAECLFVQTKGNENRILNFLKKEENYIFNQTPVLKEMYFKNLKSVTGSISAWEMDEHSCDHIGRED